MKFLYNKLDQSSNILTKFDQNPTHSKCDTSHKKGQTDRHIDTVCRSLYTAVVYMIYQQSYPKFNPQDFLFG